MCFLVLLKKLDFAERSSREDQIETVDTQASTVDWIWDIDDAQQSFKQWLQNDTPIFWIQGKPGSGKSTLVRHLSRQSGKIKEILHSCSQTPWETVRFFFDFRANKGLANNIAGLLRSLCVQIIQSMPDMDLDTSDVLDRMRNPLNPWNLVNLKETFTHLLKHLPRNLCMFVDGLDEFQGPMHELLELLLNLPQEARGEKTLKVCLASRPDPITAMALQFQLGVAMHDHNYGGIERYVSNSIKNLRLSPDDESQLLGFSSLIARRAEGIFLWARFALPELIQSQAAGESDEDLRQRLEVLPTSMEDLYANIFQRMKVQDRQDARLLFQLVCSSPYDITIRQVKEAKAVADDRLHDLDLEYTSWSIESFRRRLRARSGGLLEEVPPEGDSPWKDASMNYSEGKDASTDCSGAEVTLEDASTSPKSEPCRQSHLVKTIHRSVVSFLKNQGWLSELSIKNQIFTSPKALWVFVCCKYLSHLLSDPELEDWELASSSSIPELASSSVPERLQSSLFEYARRNLFEFARTVEEGYCDHAGNCQCIHPQSMFEYLCLVSDAGWSKLQVCFSLAHLCKYKYIGIHLDWDAIWRFRESQPWQLMIEHGLYLTIEEALAIGKYKPSPEGYDICLALICFERSPFKFCTEDLLISELIKNGAIPGDKDVIQCLYVGNKPMLETILEAWPSGRIQLDRSNLYVPDDFDPVAVKNYTYEGETVGPLWELARAYCSDLAFEEMLDVLLNRGEDINALCGPGGTIIHALIINVWRYILPSTHRHKIKAVLQRGANVEMAGLRGTPLQMGWKTLLYCNLDRFQADNLREIMSLLRDQGANCNWVEPDGTNVTREDINALCVMNEQQLLEQSQPRFESPDWYTWEELTEEGRLAAEEWKARGIQRLTEYENLEKDNDASSTGSLQDSE